VRVLIADVELCGLDIAARAADAGHEVRLAQVTDHPIGEGFDGVKVVRDWRESMRWVGRDGLVVLTGNAKWLNEMDRWRDMGWQIFGPTAASAALEIDREKGMKAMEACGIELPHYEVFSSLKDAEAFARKADQAYVFKPLGSEDDKSLTFVSDSPADMVGWLQRQQKRGRKAAKCMLQEKIDMLAEFGVSGWFGPNGFLQNKWNECWEHKKLCNGEIGPNTGEMASVLQYVETSKLADEVLVPMAPILQALGHRGDFAVGVGIDKKGNFWPFEFTSRLGWPAFFIQCASHKGDPVQWMLDLLNGEDSLKVDYRPAIGVVLAQPPWPQFNGKPECVEGIPITGMDGVWKQIHPAMMMIGKGPVMNDGKVVEAPTPQTAGEMVACVTGLGSTVTLARKSCYSAIDKVGFSDMIYRTDAGEKLEKVLPAMRRAGYALDTVY
jgi:phosphoribosylamine---glycine ligase